MVTTTPANETRHSWLDPESSWPPMRAAWLILLLTLAATAAVWRHTERLADAREAARLTLAAERLRDDIAQRLEIYQVALHAAAGLMTTGAAVDGDDWRRFAERLQLDLHYPGIKALGFARRHTPGRRATAGGDPGGDIGDIGGIGDTRVALVAPLTPINRRALGYDMHTEPMRRAAMERTCVTGEPAMTGKLDLISDGSPGFLMYLAVYRDRGDSAACDRDRLLGWVFASFRAADFFSAALHAAAPEIDVEIFDVTASDDPAPAQRLYDRDGLPRADSAADGRWRHSDTLDSAERRWMLYFSAMPTPRGLASLWLPATGGLIGLLLFIMVASLIRTQRQALDHARITDAHRATIARQDEELKALDRLKANFLSTVTHELKTPLNAIIGFAELLVAGIPTPIAPAARDQARDILAAGQEMLTMVQQLVFYTRVEAGQLTPEIRAVDLPPLLTAAARAHEAAAVAKGLRLRLDLPTDLPPLATDAALLRLILDALLDNAVKFTASGGIELRARPVAQEGHDLLEIAVADSGSGIAAARQADLFQPFRQLDAGLARAHGGAGLGLALAHRLSELLGGTLAVTSALDHGSTFSLRLPASRGADFSPTLPHNKE